MRRSAIVILSILGLGLAGCGGKGKPAAPATADTTTPANDTAAATAAYCTGYAGCAEEEARIVDFEGKSPDEMTPDERTALTEAIDARITSCRETFSSLTPHQQAWVESCTGCGGSCDVYSCLDRGDAIGEDETFACDLGFGEEPEEGGE